MSIKARFAATLSLGLATACVATPVASSASPVASSPASPPRPALLALGQQGSRQSVPWSQVGSGWLLATLTEGGAKRGAEQEALYLVDPAGGRYLLATLPAGEALQDWSGDGARALLTSVSGPTAPRRSSPTWI